jgi:hypothetical protein
MEGRDGKRSGGTIGGRRRGGGRTRDEGIEEVLEDEEEVMGVGSSVVEHLLRKRPAINTV